MTAKDEEVKERLLAYIRENPGCTYRTAYVHNHLPMTACAKLLDGFLAEGLIFEEVTKGARRFYPKAFGRRVSP